ncbi:DNA polymerase (family 10) [Halanaerobium congolense]|jgi:DNA polymerase (family 10)|uniref:DNA polymerase beta n=1 Tax=Halanaerobium congolense TaxID=54121 RepID=A0A1G7EPX7_9FIRM|nr:DNA polymerase/3'-5' exonuclease PolX [Halanaerobium congolense]PTX16972.1 DNA polymerase (family 10) [Halanaerobium congolense]PXV62593.1 DNA polymerase (family 10) [Halanaerobium congolense]SDE65724.1 DNA polymerase (family 10) [Halanaerobium congolense]SES62534.1 DNA polymerase (family 10) [Halanaerobium congolense]SFO80548.1 DNA polymerase (family 10) [Halanaerobium congolense]
MQEMSNKKIAKVLSEFADLMAIKGENDFKIRAYTNAARKIESYSEAIAELAAADQLKEIKGIGSGIAESIQELLQNGVIEEMEAIKAELPPGVIEMTDIQGLGPKTAHRFYYELEIEDLISLEKALTEGRVQKLKGFGKKSEAQLLNALKNHEKYVDKIMLAQALKTAKKIIETIKNKLDSKLFSTIEICGSSRRAKELTGDLDILIATDQPQELSKKLKNLNFTAEVIGAGDTKISIRTDKGMQTDFRLVSQEEFPSALHYFTGSQAHNVRMRQLAKDNGLKLSEYGLFQKDGTKEKIKSEVDIFNRLGLDYIIPELREDQGEIEAAQKGELPKSIELKDIKGDLHLHSRYSDGAFSIKEMAEAARDQMGYQYIAVTDHSQSLTVASGMSIKELKEQLQEIDALNEELENFKVLKGVEVDILKNGELDFEDDLLEQLDFVIASIHSYFNLEEEEMTARIIKAVKNPHVKLIGHPSGRMLGGREPYAVDLDKVIAAAAEYNTALEINASPQRLDLNAEWARKVKKAGGKISINTDAHHYKEYADMELGIATARRGWLEKEDVINTYSVKELMEFLNSRK